MGVIRRQGISITIIMVLGLGLGFLNRVWLYPAYIGAEALGLVQWLFACLSVATMVGNLGLDNIITRYYPRYEKQPEVFFSFTALYALVGVLLSILAFFLLKPFVLSSFSNEASSSLASQYYWLIYVGVFFYIVNDSLITYCKSLLKGAVTVFFNDFFQRLLVLALILLYWFGFISLSTLIILEVLNFAVILFFILAYMRSIGSLPLSFKGLQIFRSEQFKEIVNFGAYASFGRLGVILFNRLDILMVAAFINFEATGIYVIFVTISNLVYIPQQSFISVVAPLVAEASAKEDIGSIEAINKRTALNLLFVSGFVFLGIVVNIDNLVELIGRAEYREGISICWYLGIALLFSIACGVNSPILLNSPYFRLDLFAKIASGVIAVALNYFLIPEMGYTGAALGTAIVLVLLNCLLSGYIYLKMGIHSFSWNMLKVLVILLLLMVANSFLPAIEGVILDSIYRTAVLGGLYLALGWGWKVSGDLRFGG